MPETTMKTLERKCWSYSAGSLKFLLRKISLYFPIFLAQKTENINLYQLLAYLLHDADTQVEFGSRRKCCLNTLLKVVFTFRNQRLISLASSFTKLLAPSN